MAIRAENHQVASGRALTQRIITLRSQSVIPALVFGKVVLPTTVAPKRSRRSVAWAGLGQASSGDEHSFDYEVKGHAMVLITDAIGGNFHDSGMMVLPEQMTAIAFIEPYDINLQGDERLTQIPDWRVEEQDLLCLMLTDHKEYHECTGIPAQSMLSNDAKRYVLAQKFDMNYLDAFKEADIEDVEVPYK